MTAHVFLRYVAPEREDELQALGFRKFITETQAPIWMLDEFLPPGNPLRNMDTEEVSAYVRNLGGIGQIYEARMWGLCPD